MSLSSAAKDIFCIVSQAPTCFLSQVFAAAELPGFTSAAFASNFAERSAGISWANTDAEPIIIEINKELIRFICRYIVFWEVFLSIISWMKELRF